MDSSDTFKIKDAASYDNLAGNFDRHTQKYSTYAVDALVRTLDLNSVKRVLDVGCGSGIVTLALALKLQPGAQAVGVDLSNGMLSFAREAAAKLNVTDKVEFLKGDAESLDLPDGNLDAVVSLYAFRHLPNPDRAAAEAFRVLRPGGQVAIAAGSGPDLLSAAGLRAALSRLPRALAQFRSLERAACGHIEKLVDRHLPAKTTREVSVWSEGSKKFNGPLVELLSGIGFSDVRRSWRGKEHQVSSIEDFWDLQATFSSTARKRIALATASDMERLKQAFWKDCKAIQARGGRLVYRVGAAIVTGRKPS